MAHSLDEHTQSLANWLPTGRAWAAKNLSGTITRALLAGLSGELLRSEELVEEFKREILPDETTLFLDEWERALGIPCDCFSGRGTAEERRNDVLAKLAALGVQTAEDFRRLALLVYGISIRILTPEPTAEEQFPYLFPITFGLGDYESRFTLIVQFDDLPEAFVFPYTFPIPFLSRGVATVNCLVEKLRPANVGFYQTSEIPPPAPPPYGGNNWSYDWNSGQGGALMTSNFYGPGHKFDFGLGDHFTAAAWVKNQAEAGDDYSVFGLGDDASEEDENRIWFRHMINSGLLEAHIYDLANGKTKTYRTTSPGDDQWIHFAFTWNGTTDELRLYVNGVEDASPTKVVDDSGFEITETDRRGCVGRNGRIFSPQTYDGLIHSVAFWNVALTPAQIAAIYNGGNGRDVDISEATAGNPNPARHWYRPGDLTAPDRGKDYGVDPLDLSYELNLYDANRSVDIPV